MKGILRTAAALISAAALSVTAYAAEFKEISGTDTLKRFAYGDEEVSFSVYIPDSFSPEAADGEVRENGGATERELFYGENGAGYVDCVLHKSESGYDGEMEQWAGMDNAAVTTGTDLDGKEFSIVEFGFEGDDTLFVLGAYPVDENSWITVSFGVSEQSEREAALAALSGFGRSVNPETGAFLPVFAVFAGGISVFLLRKRKNVSA